MEGRGRAPSPAPSSAVAAPHAVGGGDLRAHRPALGIALMLLTGVAFVSLDTLAKYLSQSYPTAQVVWARYSFHLAIMCALLPVLGPARLLRTRRLRLQLGRGLLLLIATVLFFSALRYLPLATATSIAFVAPLLVTALSVPVLGEHVGIRRWAAVCAGFCGMLVIIRPGFDPGAEPPWAMLLPALMAFCYALYQLATRIVGGHDNPLTSLFYTALVGAVGTSVVAPFVWLPPDAEGWALMVLLGAVGGFGHFALIQALRFAPASLLAPFHYVNLLWATLFGFAVFGDLPDRFTVVGAAIIVASGLFVWYRETRLARRR